MREADVDDGSARVATVDQLGPYESETTLTGRTTMAIRDVLAGRNRSAGAFLLFAGPAVITSIAYTDPGNFATNIQAGARYGYSLLWVILAANMIATLFQVLSARLGIVTGRNLAEISRERFPAAVVLGMWIVSEVAAMATDLAEFMGGAIGLALLFDIPLVAGMAATAAATYAILLFDRTGFRPMEIAIGTLVVVIALCYAVELLIAPIDWNAAAKGLTVPSFPDSGALAIAVGIVGATVMPHALYLHSGLTQCRAPARNETERAKLLRFSNREVVAALSVAGVVNAAIVLMAASAFHAGRADVAEIETAYHTLTPLLGAGAAAVFLVSLIASGLSSSVVGTIAGQMIMQGFIRYRLPLWFRRAVTMVPAFVVVGMGIDATRALVVSQVILSLALPVPMLALIVLTRSRDVMGAYAIGLRTQTVALAGAAIVLTFNMILVFQSVGLPLPGVGN